MARKLNEVFNTEQTFVEHITPRYYKDTIDLVDLREGIELIEKKYSKYWDVITIGDMQMRRPYEIMIRLDCSRDKENYNTDTLKKIKTEKYLKEGPGAGYTIEYEITNIGNINIKGQEIEDNDMITIDCEIYANIYAYFSSYGYGDELSDIPVKITSLTIEKVYDTTEEYDIDDIYYALYGLKVKSLQGGGWSHSTYDGDISAKSNSITDTGEGFWVYKIDGYITDDKIIDYIDRCVQGNNIITTYCVFDEYDDIINDFADENEAIEFAENTDDAFKVVRYDELIDLDGNLTDVVYEESVWKR